MNICEVRKQVPFKRYGVMSLVTVSCLLKAVETGGKSWQYG